MLLMWARNFVGFFVFIKENRMLKIRMMCLYVLLARNVNAADIMNGLFDQVSGLLVHRAADVIARDLEANLSRANEEENAKLLGKIVLYADLIETKNGIIAVPKSEAKIVQQEDEAFRIQSILWDTCQNIKKGDVKTLLKIAIIILAGHGTFRLFI